MYYRYKRQQRLVGGKKVDEYRASSEKYSPIAYKTFQECINDNSGGSQIYPGRCDELKCGSALIYNECALSVTKEKFYGCLSLENINLPNCTYIEASAFQGCTSLKSIELPKCNDIDWFAFSNCSSLSFANLINCYLIGRHVFANCTSLLSVSLPVCIQIWSEAFLGCTSLKSIYLPNCSYIGWSAFQGCTSLEVAKLPVCSSTYNQEFMNCTKLSKVILGYSSVVNLGVSTFDNTPIDKGTGSVYVPASLVEAYKTDKFWSSYSSQIFAIE